METKRPIRIWLIVETILAVPATAAGGFMAMMSPMMFDAPGSTSYPPTIVLFASVVAFPLLCIAAIVLAWIAFALRRDRGALWLSLLPAIPVLTGAGAIVWMQVMNDGGLSR